MKLAKIIDPSRRYRLSLTTASGPLELEVAVVGAQAVRNRGQRTRHSVTERSFLPNARWFEFDEEAEILTFWQEGKGVAIELSGHAPYSALLGVEPLD